MSAINTNFSVTSNPAGNTVPALQPEKATPAQEDAAVRQDSFVKSAPETSRVTYSKSEALSAQSARLIAEEEARIHGFKEMIRRMLAKQGGASNLMLFGLRLHVTPQDSALAARSIEEGGEYSVQAVSDRIMEMAKVLAGGDASKIGVLRQAVEDGFAAAGVDLGGELPEISKQTYAEVMRRFDAWQSESAAPAAAQSGTTPE